MNERYELSWSICFKLRWVHTILTKLRVSQCFFLLSGQFTEKGEKRNFWEIIMHYKKGEEYFGDMKCEITQLCRVIVLSGNEKQRLEGTKLCYKERNRQANRHYEAWNYRIKTLGIYIYVERKSVSSKCLNHSGGILFSSPWWFTKNPKSLWPTPVPRPEFLFLFHKNLWCPIFDLL